MKQTLYVMLSKRFDHNNVRNDNNRKKDEFTQI
jgi:hypothetical protein